MQDHGAIILTEMVDFMASRVSYGGYGGGFAGGGIQWLPSNSI